MAVAELIGLLWHRPPCLLLDDVSLSSTDIEVWDAGAGRRTRSSTLRTLVRLLLLQCKTDDAIAANFFADSEDNCFRGIEYVRDADGGVSGREFLPMPGYIADGMLKMFMKLGGVTSGKAKGKLTYKYRGVIQAAAIEKLDVAEVRIFFGDERPQMRSKFG